MKKILFGLFYLSVLSGCSLTPESQSCPIDEYGYPKCASTEEVFDNAMKEKGDHLSVLEKESTTREREAIASRERAAIENNKINSSNNQPVKQNLQYSGTTEHPYKEKPVYSPEKVHRIWFSPWKDEKNNLHSSENIYFTTPGYWNYGGLNKNGVAGGAILRPLEPDSEQELKDAKIKFEEQQNSLKNQVTIDSIGRKMHVSPELTILNRNK